MKVTTSIKIDKDTKNEASKLASEMGLSLSSIINASLKQFVSERRVTFNAEPKLNKRSEILLRNALKEINDKRNLEGPFKDIGSLKKSLLS